MNDGDRSGSGADLREKVEKTLGGKGLDLSGFDFEDLDASEPFAFEDCTLSATVIRGDALAASRWVNCTFLGCEFVGTDLRDGIFAHCNFFDSQATAGSAFRFCNLVRSQFDECNLSLTGFLRCDAFEINYRDCLMRGAIFDATTFQRSVGKKYFNKAIFERCRMPDAVLAKLDLSSAEFSDCSLVDANLSETRFVNATMTNCDFTQADIGGADFSGADLRKSDLTGFSLTEIAGYSSMRVSAGEQHHLLASIGIEVWPED